MKRMKLRKREALTGLAFASPAIIGLIVFFVYPFLISLWYTFTSGVGGIHFAGFSNYENVINSAAFRLAAGNTFKFILCSVPLIMVISFALAMALQRKCAGALFFRTVFLFPLVIPVASVILVFQIVFDNLGILNSMLNAIGVSGQDWLHSEHAFGVLVLLYIWKNCGYNIVLLLAGLNAIPKELYEVAKVDGAGKRAMLLRITLPLMVPTFFFVFVISIINSFKSFREAFLLGGSHPHESIYMLQHFFNNNFQNLNYQRLSVAALLVFVIIFTFVFFLYLAKRRLEVDRK